MALQPAARIGPYEVTAQIGEGGMGEVYCAVDTNLGRQVAIKVLPEAFASEPERLARFEREAKTLASLNHPNIAQIYGLEKADGIRALVMELVEGPTLADRIAQGPIPVDEALPIAKQIAEALEAAHEQGIVHRDLKPANIKMRPDGAVKVLDFGLAKALAPTNAASSTLSQSPTLTSPAMLTGAGMILGTAAYMSPEQAKGREADKRSDIWAFGCVLYEMLTGRRAFDGENVSDTITSVLRDEPAWSALPIGTPLAVQWLLRRCVEKDPRKRWQAAGDVRIEIESAATEPGRIEAHAPERPKRTGMVAVAVGAALVGSALTGAALGILGSSAPAPSVSRFSFTPSEGQFTGFNGRLVAVSPDGEDIVYVADNQLYRRRMNDLAARPIVGSNQRGASITNPFFSPDGQWIGFWTADDPSLKKIALTGGPAVTVCQAANPFGVSWGDDTIVFGQDGMGILAVSASGGKAEVWVKTAPGETANNPQLLPGGGAVLFSMTRDTGNARWDSAEIVVFVRATGERRTVIRGGSAARYLSSGYIVYAVGGDLLAVPFDPDRLEVSGTPVPIVEGVMRQSGNLTAGAAHFDVSRSGTLVYVQGSAESSLERTLVWVDRQGRDEVVNIPSRANLEDPRLSPDGSRLVLNIGGPENDIWTFDLARGALMRQTFEIGEDETPMWSPDGAWIAYASTRGDQRFVFRQRADGTGSEEPLWMAPAPTHGHVEDWTRDARTLIVSIAPTTASPFDLVAVPIDGDRTPKPLLTTRFNERGARVSPDGRWMAYSSDESGREEVYVQPFPSLDRKWQISTTGGSQPVWSKQGDELFFRGERSFMAVRIQPGASFSPGVARRIFDDEAFVRQGAHTGYDVSPDARRFLFVKNAPPDQSAAAPQVVVVRNWFEELKRLVPAN
jgi:eukaryotic-like serine/threonine-protein kinase